MLSFIRQLIEDGASKQEAIIRGALLACDLSS